MLINGRRAAKRYGCLIANVRFTRQRDGLCISTLTQAAEAAAFISVTQYTTGRGICTEENCRCGRSGETFFRQRRGVRISALPYITEENGAAEQVWDSRTLRSWLSYSKEKSLPGKFAGDIRKGDVMDAGFEQLRKY